MMDPNYGVKCRIPQAPWVLFFDGASRKPAEHAALGFVLKNSNEQVVQEVRRYLGGGISSELAKYKALIAGLKKAKSLQVKHLLVKGDSQLLVNQVVGRCAVKDARLRDHLKKVWVISKDFDSLFVEFIPKDHNVHADPTANAAIDKALQIQEVVTEYFDWSGAWPATPNKAAPVSPVPLRAPTPFSNRKLRSVSPLPAQHQHQNQNLNINRIPTTTAGSKPQPSTLKMVPSRSGNVLRQASMTKESRVSNSEPSGTMAKSLNCSKLSDRFWHEDLDRLSISDESSSTESEEESHFKQFLASSLPETSAHAPATATTRNVNMASDGDIDSSENEEEFSRSASSHRLCTSNKSVSVDLASAHSAIQLSDADCDRLVAAVISRLKKYRPLLIENTSPITPNQAGQIGTGHLFA